MVQLEESVEVVEDKRAAHYRRRLISQAALYPNFNAPSIQAILDLAYTYDVVTTRLTRRLQTYGLSLSAFNILTILSQSRERKGCPLHELSELLLVTRSNVTGLVDCLEERELVQRVGDERDRRIKVARITSKGQHLLDELLPTHYDDVRKMLSGLPDEEKGELSRLLVKLRSAVQRQAADAPA